MPFSITISTYYLRKLLYHPQRKKKKKTENLALDKEEMAVSISDTAADTEATSVRKGRQSRVEWLPCSESLAAMEVFRSEVSRVYGLIDCGKLKVDKRSFPRELDAALLSLDKAIKKQQPDVSVK